MGHMKSFSQQELLCLLQKNTQVLKVFYDKVVLLEPIFM